MTRPKPNAVLHDNYVRFLDSKDEEYFTSKIDELSNKYGWPLRSTFCLGAMHIEMYLDIDDYLKEVEETVKYFTRMKDVGLSKLSQREQLKTEIMETLDFWPSLVEFIFSHLNSYAEVNARLNSQKLETVYDCSDFYKEPVSTDQFYKALKLLESRGYLREVKPDVFDILKVIESAD